MKRLFKYLKKLFAIYSVRRSYYLRLQKDLIIYGNCFEEKINYKWWQKVIRLIQRLPRDRRYVDPIDVRI